MAALYAQLGLPVVPVALNSGLFWPRRGFRKKPGTIVLEFLPAIPPGLSRKQFMPRLAAAIDEASARLAGIAPVDGPVDKPAAYPPPAACGKGE